MKRIRLFCLPYAGGSAMTYLRWKKHLSPNVELYPVELAGRGSRYHERFYETFFEAVEDTYSIIKPFLNEPYALFGHSMGSWIALEVCAQILCHGAPPPSHVFFSGRRPPHVIKEEVVFNELSDSEFESEVLKLGGAKKEAFQNRELYDVFIPVLKADFRMLETHEMAAHPIQLSCDISALYGEGDLMSDEAEMKEWGKYTTGRANIIRYTGNHFFPFDNCAEIAQDINRLICNG